MNLDDVNVIRRGAMEPTERSRSKQENAPSIVVSEERPSRCSLVQRVEIGCVDWYIYPDSAPAAVDPRQRAGG